MRGLDLFDERSLSHYIGISLRNKLRAILEPTQAAAPLKQSRTERLAAEKVAKEAAALGKVERNLALGRALLNLRAQIACNKEFGRQQVARRGRIRWLRSDARGKAVRRPT